MSKPNDLKGKKFGRLKVLERAENDRKGNTMWICECECGNIVTTHGYSLTGGTATSCGCRRNESLSAYNKQEKRTHGETHSRLYVIWRGIRQRCNNPNDKHYKDYGGRGITICAEWNESYEAFRDWALSHNYSENLSIDRIDNDGNYEPSNCRWATSSEQNANRRHYKLKHKRRRKKND